MKISSVVAINALKAAYKRLGLSMSPNVSHIQMAIELGNFLIEKAFYEHVTAERIAIGDFDGYIIEFFKNISGDTVAASVDEALIDFNKVINDTPSVTHSEVFDFYKNIAEAASASDFYASAFGKTLFNQVTGIEDSQYIFTKKVKEDVVDIVEQDYKAFSKALTDAPSLTDDDAILQFFKNTTETVGLTHAETIQFAKFLADNVGVTDDLDGSASILDDQEMQFTKIRTDIATMTDTFVRVVAYSRSFADGSDLSDDDVLTFGKIVENNSIISDSDVLDFGKLLSDTPVVSESLAFDVTLAPFTDSSGLTDSADVVPNKVVLDTTSTSDSGSYRSQGYCDFAYFAEDFVGASGTF